MIDFSRIEANRMQANYEPVDLPSLTEDLASMFRGTIEKAGLTFTGNFFDFYFILINLSS